MNIFFFLKICHFCFILIWIKNNSNKLQVKLEYFIEKAEVSRHDQDRAYTMAALHTCLIKNKNIAIEVTSDNKLVFLGFIKNRYDKCHNIIDSKTYMSSVSELPSNYQLIRGGYAGGPTTCQQTNSCENL